MMSQMINSNTIAATGTCAGEILPPASIVAKVDETNKIIMETLLTMQGIIHTVTGVCPEMEKQEEPKSLQEATVRLQCGATLLMNWTRELQNMIVG